MGSEMCIRDRDIADDRYLFAGHIAQFFPDGKGVEQRLGGMLVGACLLYTSDAADERSSVDLGGRRIIKKKKEHIHEWT